MKYKPKQGDIVRITFLDASGKGTWCNIADIDYVLEHHALLEIVGYYAKEDKNYIALSMGVQTNPDYPPLLHLEIIPKGAITDIKKLK